MDKLSIGVDIGGTRTKYGLVNTRTGEILQSFIHPTEKKIETVFFQKLCDHIEQLMVTAKTSGHTVNGIGFGVASFVHQDGIVDSTYGFQEFMEDYPLRSLIENKFHLPCSIDNDARAVALGEALYGKGVGFSRVLVLTLGTGLGFGFVVNGRFPDALPLSHMGGHITITSSVHKCYCGRTGCLESLVSSFGIINAAKEFNWPMDNASDSSFAETIFTAAHEGNSTAKKIVDQIVYYLKIGINNYITLLAPDIIILGGGISKGVTQYLDGLVDHSLLRPYKKYSVLIATSALEENAGILGTAALTTL